MASWWKIIQNTAVSTFSLWSHMKSFKVMRQNLQFYELYKCLEKENWLIGEAEDKTLATFWLLQYF